MLTMVMMFIGAAATASIPDFQLKPARPARCTGKCAEQYRLPLDADNEETAKDRAFAIDGTKCDVVGAQRCLSKRRTVLRSTEDPMDTWRASFLPK